MSEADAAEQPKARKAKSGAKSAKKSPERKANANLRPPWQPGQSGNPTGPKAGYRQEFSRAFVGCITQDFAVHGPKVVEEVRVKDPVAYLRIMASVVEKEVNVSKPFSHLDHLSDDELRASIAELNERVLLALSGAGGKGSRDAAPGQPQQAGKLPALLKAT